MKDNYSREINYLRLSITDRCNLACFYCQPRRDWQKLPASEIMQYEELLQAARAAITVGIRKIRVTGGEPLVRRGVVDFVRALHRLPGLEKVCLTTNGVLLADMARDLYAAGLRHLNLSLDTLNPERFRTITGRDHFAQVLAGLWRALELGFHPVKVNCVVLKDINDDELLDFARLARDLPLQVRFIEFMPTISEERWARHFLPMSEVRRRLAVLGEMQTLGRRPTSGPAHLVRPAGFQGELGFINPVSQHHCSTCNRLRLTASGRLRPCLFSQREIDLKGPLRQGASLADLARLFEQAVKAKPSLPEPRISTEALSSCPMVGIGG
ncbi:MAG: GTP 3',8-cyclase MoaA [Deltaproteobacteria bacterium]|nr:GTP 3',8-cyclase MoaA [Deltaproteobacteria bacterium]